MKSSPHIHCPRCEYRPRAEDRWSCVPSCGTSWHTFWTGGVCPGCGFAWPVTQCPACGVVSPHKAWYHTPPDATRREDEAHEDEHEAADARRVPEPAAA